MSLIMIFTETVKYTLLRFSVWQVHILQEVNDTLEIVIYKIFLLRRLFLVLVIIFILDISNLFVKILLSKE